LTELVDEKVVKLQILVKRLVATFSFKHCPSLLILSSEFVFATLQYRSIVLF